MTKKRTRKQTYADLAGAVKAIREGKPVKRHSESVPTHSIIPVPDLLENEVLKLCLKWLRKHGIVADRNNVGTGVMSVSGMYSYGIKGAGDIIGLLPNGRHFEIECKRGSGGRLSLVQQERMRMITKNNGLYFVVHGLTELRHYFGSLI